MTSIIALNGLMNSGATAARTVAAKTDSSFGEVLKETAQNAGKAAQDEFLEFAAKSPAEKMRAMILSSLGITEEELAALPPEEQAKIEEKIKDMLEKKMKENAQKQTGIMAG